MHIQNVDGPFMKMLQLEGLFFQKKIIAMQKGELESPFNTAKKEEMQQFSSAKALNELEDSIVIERANDQEEIP